MPVRITCPLCRDSYAVDEALVGRRARCRTCKEAITVEPARRRDEDVKADRRPERRLTERPAPRAAAGRPRDDEDDAPRRRPASPREDDEDDRPRRKKAKAGGASPLVIIGGVAAVLLLVGAVVGGAYLMSSGDTKPEQAGTNLTGSTGRKTEAPDQGTPPAALGAEDLRRVKRSTVYLRVNLPTGGTAEGTGFFAGEPGVVVTNAHVLGMLSPDTPPPREVAVVVNSGEAGETGLRGRVVGVDRDNDLAVLRVSVPPAGLPPPLQVGRAERLIETQKVYVFGFPFGERLGKNITVSESSVSSLRREGGALAQVQLNGGMHQGNSGGPVTDSRGDVVGVSVAVIRNTQINFAIPAELVQQVLDGAPGEMELGTPYTSGGRAYLPVRLTTLDPLGRAREVKLEVWSGARAAPRPGSSRPPQARDGDGPRQTVAASGRSGAYTAEAPIPGLAAGQVLWAQPVVVGAGGATRWGTAYAIEFSRALAVDRKEARLEFKAPSEPIERTLRVRSDSSVTVFRGKDSASYSEKMDGYVLESLFPDVRGLGTGVMLTLGQPKFTREAGGEKVEATAAVRAYLSKFAPTFLVNAKNEAKERGNRFFGGVPAQLRETVEELFETVCNNWEMTTLPIPNRVVKPGESWPARVPMLVRLDERRRAVQWLHVTCIYEGLRSSGSRAEAYVRLAGVVKMREQRGDVLLGRVTGHALVDVEGGYLRLIKVTIGTEVDTGSSTVRMLLTEQCTIEREAGNTQRIKPAAPPPRKGK